MRKNLFLVIILVFVVISVTGCDFLFDVATYDSYSGGTKIYSGSYGYNVAYRVNGDTVYSGSSGRDVAYTIRGNEICTGTSYYNVAYTIRGNEICTGTSYYNVAYRIDR